MLIITLAYQYASYYRGVLVRYCHDAIGLLVCLYVITAGVLVRRYQYADYYSGIPVPWFLLWRTSRLYDTFLGGLRQHQYA
jgi:hypothetical protein